MSSRKSAGIALGSPCHAHQRRSSSGQGQGPGPAAPLARTGTQIRLVGGNTSFSCETSFCMLSCSCTGTAKAVQERQGIFTWPGLEVREAKQAAWPTRLRRVIFVWEEELSSFYIRKISYLPFRTPPLVKLAGPARGWSQEHRFWTCDLRHR